MIQWNVVGAFIGPLIAAIGLAAGLFAYMNKRREERITMQISEATRTFDTNQKLMQERMSHFEDAMTTQAKQLEKQGDSLLTMGQSIARIEGRLAATSSSTVTTQ